MSNELMELFKGISQVMANTYDGARDEKGELIKAGLRREKVPALTSCECRLLDGFRAKVSSYTDRNESFPCVTITYQSEIKLEEVYSPKLGEEVEQHIAEAVKYLKKEFKKITGKSLELKKHGNLKMTTEQTSRIRTFVLAECKYKVINVEMPKLEDKKDVERSIELQKWLKLGGFKK